MSRRLGGFLKWRLSLGRWRLPAWLLGASVPVGLLAVGTAAMLASSGQAVGPVLSGSVTGSAGVVAQQALVINTCEITSHIGDDANCVLSSQRTSFTAAIEMHRRDLAVIKLGLLNISAGNVNATITLSLPAGFRVEMEDSDTTSGTGTLLREAQMASATWLLFVGVGSAETLNVTLRPNGDITPGFYTVSATINEIVG